MRQNVLEPYANCHIGNKHPGMCDRVRMPRRSADHWQQLHSENKAQNQPKESDTGNTENIAYAVRSYFLSLCWWRKCIALLQYREPGHSIGSEHRNSLTPDATRPGRKHWPGDPWPGFSSGSTAITKTGATADGHTKHSCVQGEKNCRCYHWTQRLSWDMSIRTM